MLVARIARRKSQSGLRFERVFSDAKVKPFDQIEWEKRTAEITDDAGKVIFKQENVEVPKSWSVLATKVVVSKYFYGEQNTSGARNFGAPTHPSHRRTIADWGIKDGYFSKSGRRNFLRRTDLALREPIRRVQFAGLVQRRLVSSIRRRQELRARATGFTTARPARPSAPRPQYEYPQGSACFIQSVDDNMEDIMRLATAKRCSSSTAPARAPICRRFAPAREKLSGGGRPSGPLSFLKVYDQVANVVNSGGKTRRAAKMNTLRDWHRRHRGIHRRQAEGRKESLGADRAGLRRLVQRRRLRQRDVSERKPVRARQR